MAATRFSFKRSLPGLPEGAGRAIIEQFNALQDDVRAVAGVPANTPGVFEGATIMALPGQLLRVSPPATGTLITIPAGSAQNITQCIRIAVVAGVLSPGATVAIVGGKGTINGAATLNINNYRLLELFSCGELGWFFSG